MNELTMECLVSELANRGGVLAYGEHNGGSASCPACALELAALCRRAPYWSDAPDDAGLQVGDSAMRYRHCTAIDAARRLLP